MTAREVYRYVDKRGDTIILKFDRTSSSPPAPLSIPSLQVPNPFNTPTAALINDPTDGPLSVFHVWMHQTKSLTQWSSMLLDRVSAAERWQADKKPMMGLLLWQGEVKGKHVVFRFVGYEKTMTSSRGLEAGGEPDERSPLLSVEPVPDDQGESPDNTSDTASLKSQAERPPSRYQYLWWALLVVLGEAILGLFIKGWLDADDVDFDLGAALKRALGGGLSGAAAMVLQVLLLMPVRTIMNYQYRHGTSLRVATRTLYEDGGLRRYYQGIGAALFQGPIARFGDTAANAGILALLSSNGYLARLPSPIKTIFASACAAAFRMILTPIDTLKTTLQAQGAGGTALLRERVKTDGIGSLWWGAFATAAATFVGHYPWFATVTVAFSKGGDNI
ncbi:hypothetical protein SLS60_011099 [Paraconiothyrium brasiliense]|uniref:Mitochondrial carrier n=1 Tax=Paraconiothyrium brasiliense TaxID=300254 RepID=A0ABR3QL52_9PLEO